MPVQARPYSPKWWGFVILHNCIIHPILPLADLLDASPSRHARTAAKVVYFAHDHTYPDGAG